jgi:hypothetical protein
LTAGRKTGLFFVPQADPPAAEMAVLEGFFQQKVVFLLRQDYGGQADG